MEHAHTVYSDSRCRMQQLSPVVLFTLSLCLQFTRHHLLARHGALQQHQMHCDEQQLLQWHKCGTCTLPTLTVALQQVFWSTLRTSSTARNQHSCQSTSSASFLALLLNTASFVIGAAEFRNTILSGDLPVLSLSSEEPQTQSRLAVAACNHGCSCSTGSSTNPSVCLFAVTVV